MSRQKDPETRKNEIIQVAEELFLEKGYEDTTVDDILQRTGLSKGGFYHHFKSKNEVFMSIIDKITDQSVQSIEELAKIEGINAEQKFQIFSNKQFQLKMPKTKIIQCFYRERDVNPQFHKHNIMMWEKYVPAFKRIVEQGISEGYMKVEYPEETVRMLFMAIASLYDLYGLELETKEQEIKMKRHIEALELMFTKSLGIDKGKISLVNSDMLNNLTKYQNK